MKPNRIRIIGVDCAVEPKYVGMAVGLAEGSRVRLVYPEPGQAKWHGAGPSEIAKWIDGDDPVLLAFDAPLGWPSPLGASLVVHVAGTPLETDIDSAFQRTTDLEIRRRFQIRPLEVGADKIARTAHAALALLDENRHETRLPIPLAWDWQKLGAAQVIEVYPAATLRTVLLPHKAYKKAKPEARRRRQEMIKGLREWIEIPAGITVLEQNADVLDAVVCVLAGADFLRGLCVEPELDQVKAAKKEGWIWVRSPECGH